MSVAQVDCTATTLGTAHWFWLLPPPCIVMSNVWQATVFFRTSGSTYIRLHESEGDCPQFLRTPCYGSNGAEPDTSKPLYRARSLVTRLASHRTGGDLQRSSMPKLCEASAPRVHCDAGPSGSVQFSECCRLVSQPIVLRVRVSPSRGGNWTAVGVELACRSKRIDGSVRLRVRIHQTPTQGIALRSWC